MKKISVLFVCIHNSARSQMAESYLNHVGQGRFQAESAGIEPGCLNPIVVKAMADDGIDISGNQTKSVNQYIEKAGAFDYLITVCDKANAERCPIFPGNTLRLHWGFPDPSSFEGSEGEKLAKTVAVRDKIKAKVKSWVDSHQN